MARSRSWITLTWRTLLFSLILSVVLFVIAAPLGDSKHGLGKHHHWAADLGNVVFAVFLISVVVLVILIVVFILRTLLRSRRRV